jgi:hypothetical protein
MPSVVLRALYLVAFVTVGAACGSSPKLAPKGPEVPNLSGRWTLERQSSDNVRERLLPLFERQDRRWRKAEQKIIERPPMPEASPPNSARPSEASDNLEGVSTIQWFQRQRQKEADYIISLVAPAANIEIQQSAREFRFSSDKGQGSRTLTPGRPTTLFIAAGGFEVNSGWRENSFMIESLGSGENEMNITEFYTLLGADRLEERLVVRIPGIGKESFRLVYRRVP